MPISVHSEIGPLRRVLLHRPGRELEHLVPQELERLLFDDIPYLALARQEHDTFADILRAQGCDVVYLEDCAAETLRLHPELREGFVRRFLQEGGAMAQAQFNTLFSVLMEIEDERELISRTMSGLTAEELEGKLEEGPLTRLARERRHFVLDPIPNLYFTRDPFASIGCGASVHRMFSATRRRETIYADLILRHHPDFAGTPLWYDRGEPFPIEGGDILNLSDRVLAIGLSQRTSPEGIERLAQNLFSSDRSTVETILVLDIPSVRAFMHLDTVFTQLDYDQFSVHPEILRSLRIFALTKGKGCELKATEHTERLETVLEQTLRLDHVTLIRCGGQSSISSAREQWNDGANTLCVAPGKVIVYNRNHVTNDILRQNGVEVFEMPSSELARGRGGPRCMSMPLIRDSI